MSLASHWQAHNGVACINMKDSPPLPTGLSQNLTGLLTTVGMRHILPGEDMPGEVLDPERTPGPLHAPPRVVHASGPRGGEPPSPALSQV